VAAGWNKGKKWPEEAKKRISEGIPGPHRDCECSHCSIETRLKISRWR